MSLKIYGSKMSFPCNKVLFLANDLKLDYEFIELDMMNGEHKKPEFMKIHPFGKVPAMDDNGFYLFESNTILRYLAQKANSDLYPEEFKERILVDQWLDFITSHIHQAMTRVAFNRMFARNIPGIEYDEKSVEFGLSLFDKYLPVIEEQLKDSKNNGHLANSKPSLAGFALLATLDPAEAAEIDLSQYPTLTKWRQELKAQDWYQKVFPSFEANLAKLFEVLKAKA